jgi:hypothetical protein
MFIDNSWSIFAESVLTGDGSNISLLTELRYKVAQVL